MLMASIPHLDRKWDTAINDLSGRVDEVEQGCVYFPRCPLEGKGEHCSKISRRWWRLNPAISACCCYQKN